MKVYGVEITPEQIAAGNAAMQGEFRAGTVRAALVRAGVQDSTENALWRSDRAADRLLQIARKAGRIRAINNKLWRAKG